MNECCQSLRLVGLLYDRWRLHLSPPPLFRGIRYATEMQTLQDALFICYKQSSDSTHSVAFSQHSSNQRLIEDKTFNDNDIINNLIDYEDGPEEPDSLRADKNMQGSSFPTNWKSIFLKKDTN
ncbi:uncharacterized protein TNCV_3094651 [Trichonephila clavipes]|nr:uncharacterized protein TNCV_3094651 [Trichonephila clavipes]